MGLSRSIAIIFAFLFLAVTARAQSEHVPAVHPVYDYLLHMETKGMLKHFSLSDIPLQRKDVIAALKAIDSRRTSLSRAEAATLDDYLTEFEIVKRNNVVLFESASDSSQILFRGLVSDDEKLIYRYRDSSNNVSFYPLASIEYIQRYKNSTTNSAALGNLGFRLHGTLGNCLGYYLQVTNGTLVSGDKSVALEDSRLSHNVKFADLNSDFDFTESHVQFDYDWFFASVGRENRKLGAGLGTSLFQSTNAPPHDQFNIGVKFSNFTYKFTHHSLLGINESTTEFGATTFIPSKYASTHRFAIKPSWGEVGFWEHVIYSGRDLDLAYLNPLSFFKSLEHSLHDRDNSVMGLDATIRFADNVQFKGSFLLDDIIFSEIGNGYWANKTAMNAGLVFSFIDNVNIGAEYSRVEPYTYSHFSARNSFTNDSLVYGAGLMPNSDEFALMIQYWWGNRYPVKAKLSYIQHGENIYSGDSLIKNVGSDPLIVKRAQDSFFVTFLDGKKYYITSFELDFGWEIIRGFNLHVNYILRSINDEVKHLARISLRFEDF